MKRWPLLLVLAASTARAQQATPPVTDTITVTATRTPSRLADTPASVVVVGHDELRASASPAVDDSLRQVPGFTLFRRTGSRVANPTSQGVSLRGVGASGASRAVVLDDGVPLNDPFGGWVFWGRVARASLDRVEVLRGGASDLYGNAALGGVVQFVRRPSSQDALVADTTAGSERTAGLSLFAAQRAGDWSGSLSADLLSTAGYVLVDRDQRGAVDRNATSRHTALDGMLQRAFGDDARAFVRASHYIESRNNGTPLTINATTLTQLSAGGDLEAGGGALLLRAFGSDHDYHQTFSAIAANRNSERLTVDQTVPARSAGGSMQWSRPLGDHNAILLGGEGRQVRGTSEEVQFAVNRITFTRSGGHQRIASAFAEDLISVTSRLSVTAGVRFDDWRNYDAHRDALQLASRSDSSWSPRLAAIFHAGDDFALTASAYRAFRAPTLNELYRSFRVGNVLTQANENLGPERLQAVEFGARKGPVRINFFDMRTDETIANVTLLVTPALITRQRQNLGSSRSRGVELEGDWRLSPQWKTSAGWLYTDSTVTSGALEGKRLPQVPRNQATAQVTFTPSAFELAAQLRWSGRQFDDDVNQLPLRGYFQADFVASRAIASRLEATLALENAFNRRIEASATPVITLGQPRAVRVGLRWGR